MSKQNCKGYLFKEVIAEIHRRADGNYLFSKKENEERRARAVARAVFLFEWAAHMQEFLDKRDLTPEKLLKILDNLDMNDGIMFSLNPFPRGKGTEAIKTDPLIDLLYPGKDYIVDRSENSVLVQKT